MKINYIIHTSQILKIKNIQHFAKNISGIFSINKKMPVGKHDRDSFSFTEHTIALQKDYMVMLLPTLPDHFGVPKGKKFIYKQLKEQLISTALLPKNKQKEGLSESLNKWKGDLEQVNDVTIVRVRV